jgi:hypothetical protein
MLEDFALRSFVLHLDSRVSVPVHAIGDAEPVASEAADRRASPPSRVPIMIRRRFGAQARFGWGAFDEGKSHPFGKVPSRMEDKRYAAGLRKSHDKTVTNCLDIKVRGAGI